MAGITRFEEIEADAKGSSGEIRSQLYVRAGLEYIPQEQFAEAYEFADKASRQISRFIDYLESDSRNRRLGEDFVDYNTDV